MAGYILDEIARVLPRLPRIRLSASQIQNLTGSLMFLADIVEPGSQEEANLRDPADQQILGIFKKARADYLVTGDKDLLALGAKYRIIPPAVFWKLQS